MALKWTRLCCSTTVIWIDFPSVWESDKSEELQRCDDPSDGFTKLRPTQQTIVFHAVNLHKNDHE